MTTETETGPDRHVTERLVEAGALTGPDDPTKEEKLARFRLWLASATTSTPADAGLWASRLTDDFLGELTHAPPAGYGSAEE